MFLSIIGLGEGQEKTALFKKDHARRFAEWGNSAEQLKFLNNYVDEGAKKAMKEKWTGNQGDIPKPLNQELFVNGVRELARRYMAENKIGRDKLTNIFTSPYEENPDWIYSPAWDETLDKTAGLRILRAIARL
mgnify:FL=1|jgi:hypothetical protein